MPPTGMERPFPDWRPGGRRSARRTDCQPVARVAPGRPPGHGTASLARPDDRPLSAPILGPVSTVAPQQGFLTIGQPVAGRLAHRILTESPAPPTLLVHGPRGAGKGSFVDDLLATALCEDSDPAARPCNACRGCELARTRTHPDLVFASPAGWRDDRGSGESIVAAARRWLGDVAGAPIRGRWRVIVIEQADGANEQVQNALLKALEEPTARQLFILVADDPRRLLPTIRSRAVAIRLGTVPREALARWLLERRPMTDEQAAALVRLADGRVGRALALADNPALVEWRGRTQRELLALLDHGRADRLGAVRELLDDAARLALAPVEPGEDDAGEPVPRTPTSVHRAAATAIIGAWVDLGRDLAVAAAGSPALAGSAELVPDLLAVAGRRTPGEWAMVTLRLEGIRDALEENVSPRLALETAMLAWPQTSGR
jgi:DNA polymerase III, delta subunit